MMMMLRVRKHYGLSWRDLDRLPTRPARAPVLRWWRPDRPVLAAEPTLRPDAVEDAHVGAVVVLGLSEQEDWHVLQHCPGDRHPLLLPS